MYFGLFSREKGFEVDEACRSFDSAVGFSETVNLELFHFKLSYLTFCLRALCVSEIGKTFNMIYFDKHEFDSNDESGGGM